MVILLWMVGYLGCLRPQPGVAPVSNRPRYNYISNHLMSIDLPVPCPRHPHQPRPVRVPVQASGGTSGSL